MRLLGLDTERIIVPFSSKGVNDMAYRDHVSTVVWCVCYCLSNSYAIVFRHKRRFNYQPQFQNRQKPQPLISRRAVRRRHYRPIIKYQRNCPVGVKPTTLRIVATDNDKNQRLYRSASTETATAAYDTKRLACDILLEFKRYRQIDSYVRDTMDC